jgi:hypothetical protein
MKNGSAQIHARGYTIFRGDSTGWVHLAAAGRVHAIHRA